MGYARSFIINMDVLKCTIRYTQPYNFQCIYKINNVSITLKTGRIGNEIEEEYSIYCG